MKEKKETMADRLIGLVKAAHLSDNQLDYLTHEAEDYYNEMIIEMKLNDLKREEESREDKRIGGSP